jgi:hypothetical protein
MSLPVLIPSSFLFLVVMAASREGEEVSDTEQLDSKAGGELTKDVESALWWGAKGDRSSAAQAELNVIRPFCFLTVGTTASFGSSKALVLRLAARIEPASFRAAVRFFRLGDVFASSETSDEAIDKERETGRFLGFAESGAGRRPRIGVSSELDLGYMTALLEGDVHD